MKYFQHNVKVLKRNMLSNLIIDSRIHKSVNNDELVSK